MRPSLFPPEALRTKAELWKALDEETRRAVLDRLAELIGNAALAKPRAEGDDHD